MPCINIVLANYNINHLLYNKFMSVLKKKQSILKLARHPFTSKIPRDIQLPVWGYTTRKILPLGKIISDFCYTHLSKKILLDRRYDEPLSIYSRFVGMSI